MINRRLPPPQMVIFLNKSERIFGMEFLKKCYHKKGIFLIKVPDIAKRKQYYSKKSGRFSPLSERLCKKTGDCTPKIENALILVMTTFTQQIEQYCWNES